MNNNIEENSTLDLIDLHKTPSNTTDFTFFSGVYKSLIKVDHMISN